MDFFLIFYLFPMINDFQISVDNAVIVFAINKPRFHQEISYQHSIIPKILLTIL